MYQGNRPQGPRGPYRAPFQPNQPQQKGFNSGPDSSRIVATALKVKNFRMLVEAIGEEQLAVRIESTLQRVKEMAEGINLSSEMAYHIESSLGLQSGFFDQVNPRLSAEDVLRLKSHMSELVHDETPVKAFTPPAAVGNSELPLETAAPSKITAKADLPSNVISLVPPESLMPKKANSNAAATPSDLSAGSREQSEDSLRELRRANLVLLTSRPGTKSRLGVLTELSAANVSHRLHGNKIFDQKEGQFFAAKLGLPADWFEFVQTAEAIPAATLDMLLAKTPRASNGATAKTSTQGKSKTRAAAPTTSLPKDLAPTKGTHPIIAGALNLSGAAMGRSPSEEKAVSAPSIRAAAPAPIAAKPVPAPAPVVAQAAPSYMARRIELGSVSPIVSALLESLERKAKAGLLNDQVALDMIVSLASS